MRVALMASVALLSATAAAVAAVLAPNEIQTTFFNGQPFTASTSSLKYKMTFAADGKMSREPIGKAGGKSEGTWKLSKDGFCTTWKGSKANCYRVQSAGENKWSVMKGSSSVATWTK
ncbi:MAG: hypothetical protein ACJ8F3_07260 [Xanthobacteraceae bacterium]